MEQYLIDDYNVYEDEEYLTSVDDIEDFIRDCDGLFKCGQGYYTEKENILCKIGDKFYSVTAVRDIESAKQDVGDRLYWAGKIKSVTYTEIPKPLPKDRVKVTYEVDMRTEHKHRLNLT